MGTYQRLHSPKATVSATHTSRHCTHWNGWYVTVWFWMFKKRVFVCSDCGEVVKDKR